MKSLKQYWLKELKEWVEVFWELPQNFIGALVVAITGAEKTERDFEFVASKYSSFGVSLGDYIIFGGEKGDDVSYNHELGHHKQSLILGPLYLLLIGLPSLLGNLWDRVAHRSWNYKKREKWYYSQIWEAWADSLGDVDRGFDD